MIIEDHIQILQLATPAGNPPSGYYFLYLKSNGNMYIKNSAGVETQITSTTTGVSDADAVAYAISL